jgi:mxaA protein
MRRVVLLGVVFGLVAGGAALASTPSLTVKEPRSFGYFIGDTMGREVDVRLGPGQELDEASLPRPGPLNYWLELSSTDVRKESAGDDTIYKLSLTYQTFYAPLDPRQLIIPGFTLKVKGAPGAGEIRVSDFGFLTSPIRQLFSSNSQSSGSAVVLQPDVPPSRLVTGTERTALLASAALALGSLIALAWHNAWWPFHRRPERPFTEAARFLKANADWLDDARGYRAALLRMHRAFDDAAGHRVLADDVGTFIAHHPEFAPYTAEVERLFASSRRAFFANEVEQAREAMPLPAVNALSVRLSAAERRAA